MNTQQRSWASRLAEAEGNRPYEEPDFAPVPTDPELLNEIMEAEARKLADLSWDLEDDELDDFGNPIVDNSGNRQCPWVTQPEKVSCCSSPDGPVQALLRQPFSSILLGAALCAGQPYLLWNIRNFLNTHLSSYEPWLGCSCGVLLNWLRSPNGSVIQDTTTANILFHLMVEPFALMNQ